ncbi:hypothetical protein PIB30_033090 [Stylosanthes scabra]|uniref:Uncharacterized protein n=1 Tax=Stylosanthes scabra TaxID=79078 RepID=A0ABU6RCI4_9FABA|nr:hypothetical protein [Stylosanthes scabra]
MSNLNPRLGDEIQTFDPIHRPCFFVCRKSRRTFSQHRRFHTCSLGRDFHFNPIVTISSHSNHLLPVDVCEEAVPIVVVLPAESKKELGVNQGSDREENDELLYQINEEANGWLMVRHGAYAEQVLEEDGSVAEPVLRCPKGTNIAAEKGALLAKDNLNSTKRSPSGVDGVVVDESSNGSSVVGGQHIDIVDAKDVESEDEDGRVEASETKKVWDKEGISFYSSDEEEVLARLAERKIIGKWRIDLRPRKQKQGRKVPCLEGKTITTRTLRLASKIKLK